MQAVTTTRFLMLALSNLKTSFWPIHNPWTSTPSATHPSFSDTQVRAQRKNAPRSQQFVWLMGGKCTGRSQRMMSTRYPWGSSQSRGERYGHSRGMASAGGLVQASRRYRSHPAHPHSFPRTSSSTAASCQSAWRPPSPYTSSSGRYQLESITSLIFELVKISATATIEVAEHVEG